MSIKDYNTLGILCNLAVKYKIIYWNWHELTNSFHFNTLDSMPMNPRRIFSFILLAVYAASLSIVVLPHGDVDSAFGSGKTSLATHADASHCKHIDASHAETCSTCSLFAGRALFISSPFSLECSTQGIVARSLIFSASHSFVLLTSFSRRAPPPLLTIA